MPNPELIKTNDGSDTLLSLEYGEHYHSTFGAIQESRHVFIEAGLRKCHQAALTVFEVGLGTGLNAYLTLLETRKTHQSINYIAIEKHPISEEIWERLNYSELLPDSDPALFRMIHKAAWNVEVQITDQFSILKLRSGLLEVDYFGLPLFDLVYFDAFSPEKQPELWETPVFDQLSDHSNAGAMVVTYCAKGIVRRSIIEAGYVAERIPGPPGKREMLRGTKSKNQLLKS